MWTRLKYLISLVASGLGTQFVIEVRGLKIAGPAWACLTALGLLLYFAHDAVLLFASLHTALGTTGCAA